MNMVMRMERRWGQVRKLLRLLPVPLFRRGLRLNVAASVEQHPLLAGLSVATVVDVGANRGQFSLLARHLWPLSVIHAFEPETTAAEAYARLMAGDAKASLTRTAIGDVDGRSTLFVAQSTDNSSLLASTDMQLEYGRGAKLDHMQEVSVARLDSLLGDRDFPLPALLKLDIQGGELAALHGAGDLLNRFTHILVEVSFAPLYQDQPLAGEVADFLQGRGFRLAGIGDPGRNGDGVCVQADFLFVRAS